MKILNKTINISLVFVFVFLFVPQFESQRGDELTPYQEYLIELKEYRRNCRNALKPFRYDGSLTTHYSYKEYTYAKEIEIATIQKEEYRLSFNAMGVKNDGITIRIYDKAKRFNSRVLLYEKENVANTEFTIETSPLLEKLKEAKREDKVEEEIIKHLRLKKLYVDYIIPATDRIIEMDQETGVEYKVVTKGAIILAVGYDNL
ncbi:MAG: hypothetical protein VX710_01050 [Bacteroidota bacterium]|nr:hypothetical protein [Bacteroidota bacterium]